MQLVERMNEEQADSLKEDRASDQIEMLLTLLHSECPKLRSECNRVKEGY